LMNSRRRMCRPRQAKVGQRLACSGRSGMRRDVRIAKDQLNVRFTPESGHSLLRPACPLCAKSRHEGTDDIVGPNGCPQPMSNHSAAIAVGMRGQDGLGTGCHHFWTLRSRAITLAALYPGLPVTAPPVWLLAPHRYSPLIGVL